MSAYNWIVILLCLGFFGLLYASTYDVVAEIHDDAYTATDEAATGVKILWMCWKFAPIGCLVAVILYAYMSGQKTGGGF